MPAKEDLRIAILGLGYVGLPLALGLAKKFPGTIGFDVSSKRVGELKQGIDPTDEGYEEDIRSGNIVYTDRALDMSGCNFFIVAVPTPINEFKNPDLSMLESASKTVGSIIKPGSVIVYESTVYPGVTDEVCAPIIEEVSGLKRGKDFFLGYSPERINPGDKEHTLENVIKIISADDDATLEKLEVVYGSVVKADLHRASSIRVAEAAKVIENTQRDLNIALMNELALIFDKMNISTREVLDAACTKWNFLRFVPGLVGGHCIGVDPYYLTNKAEQLGYHPQIVLAGRRINDDMSRWVAQKVLALMIEESIHPKGAKVGVFGVTFKENVSDVRNTKVIDLVRELERFGVHVSVIDPVANQGELAHEYGLELSPQPEVDSLDCIILAVPHKEFMGNWETTLMKPLRRGGVLADIKFALTKAQVGKDYRYWTF